MFTYDYDGTLISFNYDSNINDSYSGTEYYYIRNLQGDITKIVDNSGTILVEYEYDAWGNIISIIDNSTNDLSTINPYTYRGYRYDSEISLYYLNSRFYNPTTGRFINADGLLGQQGNMLGHNMYAYTQNNPIMYSDISGYAPEWHHWLRSVVAVAVGTALVATGIFSPVGGMLIGMGANSMISGYINEANGGTFDAGYYSGALTGGINGLTAGIGGSMLLSATDKVGFQVLTLAIEGLGVAASGGYIGGYSGSILNDYMNGDPINYQKARYSGYVSASLNIFAAWGSAGAGVLVNKELGALAGLFSFSLESIIDGISYGTGKLYATNNNVDKQAYYEFDFAN